MKKFPNHNKIERIDIINVKSQDDIENTKDSQLHWKLKINQTQQSDLMDVRVLQPYLQRSN